MMGETTGGELVKQLVALGVGAHRSAMNALLQALQSVPFRDRDAWVDALLGLEDVPPDSALPNGAVPYLPCGVEEILAAVLEAPISASDVFVDIGSGVGRVCLLVHLLTQARCSGVELQAPLVQRAKSRAKALGLEGVSFVHGNAADLELAGSVFFLYAPANGELLTAILGRIEAVARVQRIVVCAVGLELQVPWLRPRATSSVSLMLYDSA